MWYYSEPRIVTVIIIKKINVVIGFSVCLVFGGRLSEGCVNVLLFYPCIHPNVKRL